MIDNDVTDMTKKQKKNLSGSLLEIFKNEINEEEEDSKEITKNKTRSNISHKERIKRNKKKRNQKISRRKNRS